MNHPLLKILVVLFSISAAAAYVWHASQKRPTVPAQVESMTTAGKADQDDSPFAPVVTDEEVRVMKESMLSTSKSGIIMRDGDIRKMLEAQRAAGSETKPLPQGAGLIPSSKSATSIIPPSDLKDLIEKKRQQTPSAPEPSPNKPSPQNLAPSSKSIDAILTASDLKKLVDKTKQEPRENPDDAPQP